MFIEADVRLGYGVRVDVVLQLPGINAASRLPAIVRWGNDFGFGVQFLQLGARETHALAGLVASAEK